MLELWERSASYPQRINVVVPEGYAQSTLVGRVEKIHIKRCIVCQQNGVTHKGIEVSHYFIK